MRRRSGLIGWRMIIIELPENYREEQRTSVAGKRAI
jgi:hypothetical protein